jgi:hypothetical protein
VALEIALAMALDRLEAADSTADDASEMTAEAEEATAEATDEAAEVVSGISMGTPAALQVVSTAEIVVAWSAAEHAFCTQGWTWARSSVPFLQWQAKSVKSVQPSLPRGVRKQVSYFVSGWYEYSGNAKTYSARRDVVELRRGDGGQSDERGNSEGLHIG